MADTEISALTGGTTPNNSDLFVVARSGSNVSLTWTELLAATAVAVDRKGPRSVTTRSRPVNVASTTEASGTDDH